MLETVVVGGGIAGCAAALGLWRRGAAVTLVEGVALGGGATGASAGILAAQYEAESPTPLFRLKLAAQSRFPEFAAELERLAGERLPLRWDGLLAMAFSPEEHSRATAMAAWQRSVGLPASILDAAAAAELEAGMNPDAISCTWLPEAGWVDTQRLPEILSAALGRTGVRIILGNRVAEIRQRGGAVAGLRMTDGRTLEADAVILAAGAWAPAIGGLPRAIPVRPVRGQMLRFAPGAVALSRVMADQHGRYVVPRSDGSVLAGSTMEEVGFDQSITDAGLASIRDAACRLAPGLRERKPLEHWAGLRPLTIDSAPILGPDPELHGLFYATGYGRGGILIGPLAGEIVAAATAGEEPPFDWRPFAVDRFGSGVS